ncbi:MAG: thiamine phosphate synthase [Coprobacter sp.]|nr:thiamine phosphate synthase [Coprobacter sp.]
MQLIGISQEHFFGREGEYIPLLLDEGLDCLHLRKPHASLREIEGLLKKIPSRLHGRIVLHDGFELLDRYGVKGIHLNRRNPSRPPGYDGYAGRSCHSVGELATPEKLDYRFLSPLFDSLSKTGYRAGFSAEELDEAARKGLIGETTVALGGITPERLPEVKRLGFGGAALLGYLWEQADPAELRKRMRLLLDFNRQLSK